MACHRPLRLIHARCWVAANTRTVMQACLTRHWLQDDLHSSVPSLITALAELKNSHPVLAGRLKAAALQLLPPLLDGLHARRLSSTLDGAESSERLQKRLCSSIGVRTSCPAHSIMSA